MPLREDGGVMLPRGDNGAMPSRSGGAGGVMPLGADNDGDMPLQGAGGAMPLVGNGGGVMPSSSWRVGVKPTKKLKCKAVAIRHGERCRKGIKHNKMVVTGAAMASFIRRKVAACSKAAHDDGRCDDVLCDKWFRVIRIKILISRLGG
jgi:hypothetical protein